MSSDNKILLISNVIFEQYGNQSVQNFVEGLLLKNCKVLFLTTSPHESEYMRKFIVRYPNLTVEYLLSGQKVTIEVPRVRHRLWQAIKDFVNRVFTYHRYPSNSKVLQWFSIGNTYTTLRHVVAYIRINQAFLGDCDKYIFVDVFGGLIAKYIRIAYPRFWETISHKTVGYYLGTVMKQFGGCRILGFCVMPLSFLGSYKVPFERLIITDDGTDGERVFRDVMSYRDPILYIRNGIDERLSAISSHSRVQRQYGLKFVTCSRLTRWKRIDRAIRFVYFIKTMTDCQFHLTIIGDGEERGVLKDLVHSLDLNDDTTFTGPLEYHEALERIAENNYYIVFNDLSNMGNQILESIFLGLIPISIDDGSTDSLLKNGFNSIKFPMCVDFERNAARIFISSLDENKRLILEQNLRETKKLIFTWRERNRLEHDFMFSGVSEENR